MAVPYTFANATTSIPLSQLDSNFSTAITLGNTATYLGNTIATINNLTLGNVTISSGSATVTSGNIGGNVTINTTGTANTGALAVTGAISSSVANAGGLTQEAIQTVALQNSWVNYGAGYQTFGYWKDSMGVVHLQGLIKSGTTTAGTLLFTLPAGYRPTTNIETLGVAKADGSTGAISIATNGQVTIEFTLNATWSSLGGLTFRP